MPCTGEMIDTSFCVLGGGAAGFCAAVSSARHGVKTVLVHAGQLPAAPADGLCDGGLCAAWYLSALAVGGAIDAAWEAVLSDVARREENLTVLVADAVSVSVTDGQISAVTAHCAEGGRVCIRAALFADCAAGDLLALAGAVTDLSGALSEENAPDGVACVTVSGVRYGVPLSALQTPLENLFFAPPSVLSAPVGQAIGTAAALAVKYGVTAHGVGAYLDELAETLQYDGCFLPYRRRTVSAYSLTAELSCDDAVSGDILNLRTGIDRNDLTYGEGDQGFTMALGATVEYHMEEMTEVSRVRIVFDGAGAAGEMPPALAKVYALEIETERGWEGILFENANTQALVSAAVCRPLTGIRLTVMETWGAYGVHLFSFDFE